MHHFAPSGVRRKPRNSLPNCCPLGGRHQIGAAQSNDVGPRQPRGRLAQQAAWKDVFEPERLQCVEENNVEVAGQPTMLEAVV